jgi:hypothetical protein
MIDKGYIDEKGAEDPDPVDMVPAGEYRLRNDKTASDGLNGSILVNEGSLKAVGASAGDPVRVYAEANARWILYERDTYSDRSGIGMPKDHRAELGLDSNNRTVRLWLSEAETSPDSGAEEPDERMQVDLTGDEATEQEYVALLNDEQFRYHYVTAPGEMTTECGIDFEEEPAKRFTDPGDAFEECSDCAIRSSDEMTNKELVEWLGEQAGFDVNDGGAPAYLSKHQLVALRDLVLELQDQAAEEQKESAAYGVSEEPSFG